MQNHLSIDSESQAFLTIMGEQERLRNQRIPGVRSVLVVLSSAGMVFDLDSLRQKIKLGYPEATVYFMNTQGQAVDTLLPSHIDLLIDFTGPKSRQGVFFAKRLRRMARVAVGRNVGLFRKRIYDRVLNEKADSKQTSTDSLERERKTQRNVMALAGIAFVQSGDTPLDRAKTIALELPPMSHM